MSLLPAGSSRQPENASPTTPRSSFTTTARRWTSRRSAGDARPDVESGLTRNLVLAGDRAWQLDTLAAEAYYRRALELSTDEPAHATVLSKLANVLAQRGEMDLAVDAFHAAIAVLRDEDPVGAGIAIKDLARATWGQGDVDVARELGYEAISILEEHPGPELVDAYGSAAQRAAIGGRFAEATGYVEKGLALAAELGVANVMALVDGAGHRPWVLRRPPMCQRLPGGPDLGFRLGLGRTTAVAMNNYADALFYFDSARAARDAWGEGTEFARERGLAWAEMWTTAESLRALLHLGEWDELQVRADEVLRWAAEHGGGQVEIFPHLYLTEVLVHRGDIAGAAQHVDALMPRARESGDPQVVVPGVAAAALVESARGDQGRALGHVLELEALTKESAGWRTYCLTWPARIAAAAGELHLIEAFLDGSDDPSNWNACARPAARALLAEAGGVIDGASTLYRDAAERWSEFGSVTERGYALLGLGRCGDAAAMREGSEIFARLGASPVLASAA